MSKRNTTIMAALLSLFAVVALAAVISQSFANENSSEQNYVPQFTASGDLILPANDVWRDWFYVGSPLTPNALNNGAATFPEFHNVYISPWAYAIYRKTNQFPEGTVMFKENELTLGPAENSDGSRTEPSGRGYFPGPLNGGELSIKDSKRFAASGGWGYFDFGHHEPKDSTAKLQAKDKCAFCHIASAKKDLVWTQFYPSLDK